MFREEGDIGPVITLGPKILLNVFLFVGSTTLGTILNFDWLVHYFECSNVLTTIKWQFCVSSLGVYNYINSFAIVLSL